MKLLENSLLESLASQINNASIDCILDLKLEAYSCKMVQVDKKQWKNVDGVAPDRQPLSPPDDFLNLSASPIGHSCRMRHLSEPSCSSSDNDADDQILLDSVSIRTLFDLRTVLNMAYPDYDFSDVKSNAFSLIPTFDAVTKVVDGRFAATVNSYLDVKEELWTALDSEIEPKSCNIYGYKSDVCDDPFSEDGCMWGFSFIFFNKNLKRVLLFSCRALSQNAFNVSNDEHWDLD